MLFFSNVFNIVDLFLAYPHLVYIQYSLTLRPKKPLQMTSIAGTIPEFSRRISGSNRFVGPVEIKRFIIIWGKPGSERKRTITLLKKRSTMLKTWPTPKFVCKPNEDIRRKDQQC